MSGYAELRVAWGPSHRIEANDVSAFSSVPTAQGLCDPNFEHDACGVAFVATLTGYPATRLWCRR